jgi:histidine triad (HIT) family protein
MNDCLFCKIIKGEIPSNRIYEDEDVYAFLDITPNNAGHTLVVPKIHQKNIYEMDEVAVSNVFIAVRKLAIAIKKAVGADGINIAMNNDTDAGQVIFHAHVHVIPRYKKDGFKHWKGEEYEEGKAKEVEEKIKDALG